jgi:hypothetical protein
MCDTTYKAGEWYSMTHAEFHSIRFSYGARVLFFEGSQVKPESYCLVPYVNGQVCDTFYWREWMMKEVVE